MPRAERASPSLADLTWPEADDRARAGAVLAVPLGSTEQHGPHLPLGTDAALAVELCTRLASALAGVIVAPPIAYGSSGEHSGFAGTLSIGQQALEILLLELGRSACETFARVLFVSAHGGNAEPVARAVARLRAESRDVRAHLPRWPGDAHAGRSETALMLAIAPSHVHRDRAVAGNTRPLPELIQALRTSGVRAVSPSGVLGDPTGASADEGAAMLETLTARLIADVRTWQVMP